MALFHTNNKEDGESLVEFLVHYTRSFSSSSFVCPGQNPDSRSEREENGALSKVADAGRGGVFVSCVSFRGMCLLFGSLGLSLPRWLTATSRLILSFSCGGVSWYPVVTLLSQSVCPYLSLEDVS